MTELLRDSKWVFFSHGDDVYRAPSGAPLDVNGIPMGGRFFCPVWQWTWRQENGVYPFEQGTLLDPCPDAFSNPNPKGITYWPEGAGLSR